MMKEKCTFKPKINKYKRDVIGVRNKNPSIKRGI